MLCNSLREILFHQNVCSYYEFRWIHEFFMNYEACDLKHKSPLRDLPCNLNMTMFCSSSLAHAVERSTFQKSMV